MTGNDVEIWALGKMVSIGISACKKLKAFGIDAGLVNVRIVKPIDKDSLLSSAARTKYIVTLEDNICVGGFGQSVAACLAESGIKRVSVKNIGWPDQFIEHGDCEQLFRNYGLDGETVAERIREFIEGKT